MVFFSRDDILFRQTPWAAVAAVDWPTSIIVIPTADRGSAQTRLGTEIYKYT